MYHLLTVTLAASVLVVSCFWGLDSYREDCVHERVISCHSSDKDNITLLFNDIGAWTRISLQNCTGDQKLELTHNLNFSRKINLEIKGNQTATINCTNARINFENISALSLENLHIVNCGAADKTSTFTGGVNIVNCSNVTIRGVTIELSQRTGLTLVNTSGQVTIENSTFLNNGQKWKNSERAVPFQLTANTSNGSSERGGGLQVLLDGSLKDCLVTIIDCKFLNNSASHGGGIFLMIQEEAKTSKVAILNTTFDSNNCREGGGGLQVGFGTSISMHMHAGTMVNSVEITVQDCTFSSNRAEYGGGVAIFSTTLGTALISSDILTFTRCTWRNNSAVLGLAVDIALSPEATFNMHRHLPSPVFADCEFIENKDESVCDSSFIVNKPRSVLFVTGFTVVFRGETTFRNNSGSAIEATATILDFAANSSASFINNQGVQGGAWNLQALTTVYFHENSHFLFQNNTALSSGGAIFVQFADKQSLFSSKSCFIQYVGRQNDLHTVSFEFLNNSAGALQEKSTPTNYNQTWRYTGDTIWATSIIPCFKDYKLLPVTPEPISRVFKWISNITFNRGGRQISTAAHHFAHSNVRSTEDSKCMIHVNFENNTIRKNPHYSNNNIIMDKETLHLIPGISREMPLKLVDDLCSETFFLVQVRVTKSDKNLYIHPTHSVITNNYITLYGDENQSGRIQLTTLGIRSITVTINVSMDTCPPGFVNDNSRGCICSINNINTKYRGIDRCNQSEAAAYIPHGFWVGYMNDTNDTKENRLAVSLCPKGFCSNTTYSKTENTTENSTEIKLPSNASDDISAYICNANRTGRVCGNCKENHSAYYHSRSFVCKSNDLCHLGWMFYVLSELVPVTLLFLVVIAFNISFTSGPLNGVIFFMQIVDTFKLRANWFRLPLTRFTQIHKLVYRMFSLNFFSLESLSFCLWSGASALDLLAFKYVTIVYSLLLIIGTVALLKVCSFKFCDKYSINLKGSVIHGLSAFLVMSYSECTSVSLMIMTRGTLTIGPSMHRRNEYFAFYNGNFTFMGPDHLKYALPAIFFIMTLVLIPPLILFSYPLCYKLFALLRIEESKCVHITCKIFPMEKIKPLFDSIQSAFKDRYRFFSGLYFIYRLSSLATFSIAHTLTLHYTVTGFQLVCMLTLHATCRPYKKSWHNVLDACLFFNLFLINGLTYINYYLVTTYENQESTIQYIGAFQTGLILLPLVYLIVYTSYRLIMKLKSVCANKCSVFRQAKGDETDDGQVLYAIDSRDIDESFEERSGYQLLKQEQHRKQEQEGSKM